MSVRTRIFCLLALAVLLVSAGCSADSAALPGETDEPLYREGQQLRRQDRLQEALVAYLKLISKRGDDQAPESHLEVGIIYLDKFKNPIAAIYHFQRYLELEPNSRLAPNVLAQIARAKLEFARTLPAQPLESQAGRMDSDDEIERLRNENNELKGEIAALRANGLTAGANRAAASSAGFSVAADEGAAPPVPIQPADAEETNAPPINRVAIPGGGGAGSPAGGGMTRSAPTRPVGRTHVVVKGDTLYNLAVKYYGSGARRHDIVAANRDLLPTESSPLKIGMELKIP